MKQREQVATARRIPVAIHDESGVLAAGCVPVATSDLQVSVNGGAWEDADGTLVDVGGGLYYYQCIVDDTNLVGVVCVKVAGVAGYRTEMAFAPVGDSTTVRVPIVIYDVDGELYAGFSPTGSQLQTSTHGGAFNDATGDWLEMGSGGYVYEHDKPVTNFLVVKAESAGVINTALAHGFGDGVEDEAGEPVVGDPVVGDLETIDHLEEALDRLAEQFVIGD